MLIFIPSVRENMAAGTPYSLDLDAKGRIWISFLEGFVVRMDDIGGAALQQFGSPGKGDWQFRRPMGIVCMVYSGFFSRPQYDIRLKGSMH